MPAKTNAVRIVEQAGVACKEAFYEYDENDLSGIHAANSLALDPEQVYKTLVTRGPRTGINIFCIPVACELDLKKAAKAAGDKSIEMIQVKELLSTTGYVRGGCSPLGMKKQFPTVIDSTAENYSEIYISGGRIGTTIQLNPKDLASVTGAIFAPITV